MNHKNSIKQHSYAFKSALDGIALYQNTVIVFPWLWGIYALTGIEPPTYVSVVMPHHIYAMWVALHVIAPPMIWAGQISKNSRVRWPLQAGGNVALVALAATYMISVLSVSRDTQDAIYQQLFFAGFAVCTVWLVIRATLKIAHSEGLCDDRNGE